MNSTLTSVVALSVVGLLAACQEEHHAEAPAPRPVLTVVVALRTARTVGFAGTVEPRYKSNLGFRVLGRIISRDVNVGDVVKKGQRLAMFDPLAYELAVRSAQADLVSATARLENAAATETRQRTLLGQVIQPGQTVVSVARPNIREAVVDLPESIGRDLRPEARFDIALQIDPSVRAAGSVREIAPQADPATRTRRVRIALDNPLDSFRLGTTITATVSTQAVSGIELPVSALLERDGKTMIWVVDPATRTVSTRDVTIGAWDGSSIRVLDGLTAGTRVVTAGVHSLTPNQTVKIADEASQ